MSEPLRIPKNATEELRLGLSEYKGHRLVNLRLWWTPDDAKTWHPSKHGFAVHVEALPELLAGLTVLEADARRRGWLEDASEHPRLRHQRRRREALAVGGAESRSVRGGTVWVALFARARNWAGKGARVP